MRRRKISKRGSRKLFTATAMRTHKVNTKDYPDRGGVRM